jgi:PHD/YefM family antitoxin component YafN of YafNO toxin-antitoxin module
MKRGELYREPIFITKNGESDIAVMSIETYEEITGKLSSLLEDGLNDIKNGNILTEEEMDKELIETALTKYVNNRKSLKELKGKIKFTDGYDHKKMREQI